MKAQQSKQNDQNNGRQTTVCCNNAIKREIKLTLRERQKEKIKHKKAIQ